MASVGGSKTPLALTTLPGSTLAELNRGRLRGWVAIAAILLAMLAGLAWPDLLGVLILAATAAALAAAYVWISLSLRGAGLEELETDETSTGERD